MGKRPLFRAVWLTAGCVLSCAQATPEPEAPPSSVEVRAAPEPAPTASEDEQLARVLARVAKQRQLSALSPVHGSRLSRSEMAQRLREQMLQEIPPEVVEAQTAFLILLHTAEKDFDYLNAIRDLLGSELAGFYDPLTQSMVLAEELKGAEYDITLAHELVHALQDQHYNLKSLSVYAEDQGDRKSAIHALAEGDATSAMFDDMLSPRGQSALDLSEYAIGLQLRAGMAFSEQVGDVPALIKRSLIAPYDDGLKFVHALRRRGGWTAVNAAWSTPPETTEQLLHVEKYDAREPAVSVPVPDAPGPEWKDIYHDVLGEQTIALLLEEWAPRRVARSSAEGWGGDRVAVFRQAERYTFAWHIVMDDEPSASRLFQGLVPLLGDASLKGPPKAGTSPLCAERDGLGPVALKLVGRHVVVVAGPFSRNAEAAETEFSCAAARTWSNAVVK